MKKHIIFIGIISVILMGVLSGCNDHEVGLTDPNDPFLFFIEEPKIRTVRFIGWNERDILVPDGYDFVYHPDMEAYEEHGSFGHMEDYNIDQVQLEANFYGDNGILLSTQRQQFYDIPPTGGFTTKGGFLFKFDNSTLFETVDLVNFSFNVFE